MLYVQGYLIDYLCLDRLAMRTFLEYDCMIILLIS